MGIQGLLPFLKCASKPVNIQDYSGCTVAIDSYCWLHKGAFACADKLARGEHTDVYISYCMKYINMLLSHNIKPILVFDGRHLPAKAETEKGRRESREANRRKAAELLRMDRGDEARTYLQRCVDITPEMASALIKKCHAIGVDCIVAPYEADAQLAYLSINNIAHIVITEDSDLILFGCKLVIFKMNSSGYGMLVDQEKIPLAMKMRPDQFSMDKFRHMCILSGCDYLPSLPGIGLQKACKFIKRTAELNMSKALTRLGAHLNMANLIVTPNYKEKFLMADIMFKHQAVFDPRTRKIVPLTPLPEGVDPPLVETLPPETSYQLALGNLNPFTLEKIDNWDPDNPTIVKTPGWNTPVNKKKSIWSKEYSAPKPLPAKKDPREVKRKTTQGKVVAQPVDCLLDKMASFPFQKKPEDELNELRLVYGIKSSPTKDTSIDLTEELKNSENKPLENVDETCLEEILSQGEEDLDDQILTTLDDLFNMASSPVQDSTKCRNPFSCNKSPKTKDGSPKRNFSGLVKMSRQINKTVIDSSVLVQSRFFDSEDNANTTTNTGTTKMAENHLKEEDIIPLTPSPKKTMDEQNLISCTPKNVFSIPPKKSFDGKELYKNFSTKEKERPSFLSVIDSMSKFMSKQEEMSNNQSLVSGSNFKWTKDSKKQSSISNFVSPSSNSQKSNVKEDNKSDLKESSPVMPSNFKSPPSKSPKSIFGKKSGVQKTVLQPARVVGLKRKKLGADSEQPSIFEMFAFQPKSKLKTEL